MNVDPIETQQPDSSMAKRKGHEMERMGRYSHVSVGLRTGNMQKRTLNNEIAKKNTVSRI